MQQQNPERRFAASAAPEQTVYRFAKNAPAPQGWEPQGAYPQDAAKAPLYPDLSNTQPVVQGQTGPVPVISSQLAQQLMMQPVQVVQNGQMAQPVLVMQSPAQPPVQDVPASKKAAKRQKRADKKPQQQHQPRSRRRHFSIIWNLLAVIGLGTVLVQGVRYIIIPALIYLNSLGGGV